MTEQRPSWLWLPPPDGPDPAPESCAETLQSPAGSIVAARIRGKRHRHLGTHCDDWFTIGTTGPWAVIAVSDGAGSKLFSRVGARIICESVVDYLCPLLANAPRPDDAPVLIQEALQSATWAAEAAIEARAELPEYQRAAGRPIERSDFWATCLVVVHGMGVTVCAQVGDGAILAFDQAGEPRLLGTPSAGEFAGETEFLLSYPGRLANVITIDREPVSALLVMTDGVSDDFIPPLSGARRLRAELILNGALSFAGLPPNPALEYAQEQLISGPRGVRAIPVRQVPDLAVALGVDEEDLLRSDLLLGQGRPPGEARQADRLLEWLEGYTVRGSFDDRTLVALEVNAE